MSAALCTINYLPSWQLATDRTDAPGFRTRNEDGTAHWSEVKRLSDSGVQYIHAVNHPSDPSSAMLLGTLVHYLLLGHREGAKRLVRYDGERRGNAWKDFVAEHAGAEILTAKEWAEGEVIADAVRRNPVAQEYMISARFEVPLKWEESGIACSTSGVDILQSGRFGDLKTASTTEVERLQKHCFRMGYHGQLAWYRRGLRANGIDVSRGAFLICVETKAPYEVVVLQPDDALMDLGDRHVSLLLEKLRLYTECNQFPPRAQAPVVWSMPGWAEDDEEDE